MRLILQEFRLKLGKKVITRSQGRVLFILIAFKLSVF